MTEVAYCTREKVQAALNSADTFRSNTRIDSAIRAATTDILGYTGHYFYPTTAVRYPDRRRIQGPILWLNSPEYEVISVTSFATDGNTLTEGTDFFLEPEGYGPPFTSLRLRDTSGASFSTLDRGNVLTGQTGASARTRAGGVLAGAVSTTTATTLTVSDSSLVGVGDLLTIGSERINVVNKSLTNTTVTISGAVAASAAARSITVSDGSLIREGELVTVGAERMFIESIAGNVLTVRRAENGSLLTTHANADIVYAPRTCTVERGVTGTTAASHADASAVLVNDPPALVQEAALGIALVALEQSRNAYGRVVGSGDNQREASGRSLASILDDLVQAYGTFQYGAV